MEEMNQVEVNVFQEGDIVTGVVTKLEEKQVLVEVEGSKLLGIIPISELSSLHIEKTDDTVSVGDQITAKVKKVEEEAVILSKKAVDADRAWKSLEVQHQNKETLEVVVKDVVKGGLVVDVGIRGFIPASLVETHFVEDFADYKDRILLVKIVELDQEKNRIILSHRAVSEAEESEKMAEVFGRIQAGDVLTGTIQRLTNFGAFVDIGGIDGLVHVSQLSYGHVAHPSEVVQEGQEVKVKVLSVDLDNERISLSIKDTLPGPWGQIEEKVKRGDVLEGTVKRLTNFGAFVEIFPSVEGLVHISQISTKHIKTPQEVLSVGEKVTVKVLDVNETDKRISLSIRELLDDYVGNEDYSAYTKQSSEGGFSLKDVLGDQLKKFNK